MPVSADMPAGTRQNFWIIDGRLIGGRDNVGAETPREAREMTDIVLHDMRLRYKKQGRRLDDDLLRTHRLFVACQTDDDLPYVLSYGAEDNLMIGSDYGHADNASELLALNGIRDKGEIAPAVIDKILAHNPARFYGLAESRG